MRRRRMCGDGRVGAAGLLRYAMLSRCLASAERVKAHCLLRSLTPLHLSLIAMADDVGCCEPPWYIRCTYVSPSRELAGVQIDQRPPQRWTTAAWQGSPGHVHTDITYSGGRAGGSTSKRSGERESTTLSIILLTCAKHASSLEWLASTTICPSFPTAGRSTTTT